jgi:hypothetical protein
MIQPQPKPVSRPKAPRKPMARRLPRRLFTAQNDEARKAWVRTQVCNLVSSGFCDGPTEAHHAGKKPGMGMKADDSTTVPLCRRHHRLITDHAGPFTGMTRAKLRELQDKWIAETTARYLAHGSRRVA